MKNRCIMFFLNHNRLYKALMGEVLVIGAIAIGIIVGASTSSSAATSIALAVSAIVVGIVGFLRSHYTRFLRECGHCSYFFDGIAEDDAYHVCAHILWLCENGRLYLSHGTIAELYGMCQFHFELQEIEGSIKR